MTSHKQGDMVHMFVTLCTKALVKQAIQCDRKERGSENLHQYDQVRLKSQGRSNRLSLMRKHKERYDFLLLFKFGRKCPTYTMLECHTNWEELGSNPNHVTHVQDKLVYLQIEAGSKSFRFPRANKREDMIFSCCSNMEENAQLIQ